MNYKLFKKLSFFLSLVLGTFIASSVFAVADIGIGRLDSAASKGGYAPATATTAAELVGSVIGVALSMVGAIFLVLVFYAGYLWMTAHGEEGQVDKAKRILQTSTVGLIIALGAYSITNFVVPRIVERTTGKQAAPANESGIVSGDTVGCCFVTDDGDGSTKRVRVQRQLNCLDDDAGAITNCSADVLDFADLTNSDMNCEYKIISKNECK